ncbi:cytochrome P450 [Streptomyces sp. NPDC059919]|uniref:cytochrome P450 n=1 Tax=Streptomyces sp. NPDC059919 TaxID=3347004 RepID=UPI00365B9312
MLRFDTIADIGLPRGAVSDVTFGAPTVRSGDTVVPSPAHAGRDPAVFVRPDTLDITCSPTTHRACAPRKPPPAPALSAVTFGSRRRGHRRPRSRTGADLDADVLRADVNGGRLTGT